MIKFMALAMGGWIGWWIGAHIGLMTAFFLSVIGSALGVYCVIKWMP